MTDLTDRMRTCAAALIQSDIVAAAKVAASRAAADLLIEASNVLEMAPEPLGEPMALLEPMPPAPAPPSPAPDTIGQWYGPGDILPPPREGGKPSPRPNRVCPQCDSRTHKRVYRQGHLLMQVCPVCAAAWEYKP